MDAADYTILERWLSRRDPEAFTQLVALHAGHLYGTCRRILRNDAEAQDLMQECFESLARVEGRSRPRQVGSWLHGMAVNKCLMRLRAEGRRRNRESVFAAAQPAATEPQWDDIGAFVDEAIAELPDELQIPVVLHFLYGQSHDAIARSADVPRRTVSHRIERGVELVGKALRQRGVTVPTVGLAAMLGANLGEAASVPPALVAALGRLALQPALHSTAQSVAVSGTLKAILSAVGVKQIVLATAGVLALFGAAWGVNEFQNAPEAQLPSQSSVTKSAHTQAIQGALAQTAQRSAGVTENAKVHAATRLTGTVMHFSSKQPVPGVSVSAWNTDTRVTQFESICDGAGQFTMEGLTPGTRYTLLAREETGGYRETDVQSVTLDDGEFRTGVIITVCQSSISGVVLDKSITNHPESLASLPDDLNPTPEAMAMALNRLTTPTNEPVAGVKLVLGSGGADNTTVGHVFDETVSDEFGQYQFRGIRPGQYVLRMEIPQGAIVLSGRNPDRFRQIAIGPDEKKTAVDFALRFDAASLTGTVLDADGNPVANAEVSAAPLNQLSEDGDNTIEPRTGTVTGTSNDSGAYRLDGLCPADMFSAGRYLIGGPLPRDATYVIDARAEGFAAAQVVVPIMHGQIVSEANNYLSAERARARRLQRSNMEDGLVKQYRNVTLPHSAGNVIDRVDFTLLKSATVSGTVRDTQGATVPKCRIRLLSTAEPDPNPKPLVQRDAYPDWVETGPAGDFQIATVPAGQYQFEVSRASATQKARNPALDVAAGVSIDNLDVIVESEADRGRIVGNVVDAATGSPITKFSISLFELKSPGELTPAQGNIKLDEAKGTFTIVGMSPGTATLFAFAEGYAAVTAKTEITRGQDSPMTIALPLQAIVEGAMTVNGAPAEGSVVAERTDGAGIPNPNGYYFDPFREAKADASGSFRLDGLPPGEYTLSTSAVTGTAETTFFRHESVRVQVEAGTTTQVSLNVTGSASIQGTFSFPTKYRRGRVHLLEGDFTAQLSGANPEDYRRAMRASTERMRESGAYSFDHLDPGTYTLIGLCYNNRELEGTGEETDRPQVGKLVHLRDRDHLTIDLIFDTP